MRARAGYVSQWTELLYLRSEVRHFTVFAVSPICSVPGSRVAGEHMLTFPNQKIFASSTVSSVSV